MVFYAVDVCDMCHKTQAPQLVLTLVPQTLLHLSIELFQAAHGQSTNICCSDCFHVVGISSEGVYLLGQRVINQDSF